MYELTIEGHFAAAHNLREYRGECERLHGHNWRVVAEVTAEQLNDLQMVMDFRDLKDTLKEVLSPLDHSYLNDVPPFDRLNPTTENLSRHVAEELARRLPEGITVQRVSCWESDGCGASYVPQRNRENDR
jgi:6-pyruvoyltetrahydropterin/6-carboxytetrahydropterin synthase